MADIKKYLGESEVPEPDEVDREEELKQWPKERIIEAARLENLVLEDEHWDVIEYLRDHYLEHGRVSARELSRSLAERFAHKGGRAHLYRLFPQGPVSQGCRIAGVPVPPDASDPAFGSSF